MEVSIRQRIEDVFNIKGLNITSYSNGNKTVQRRLHRQIKEGASITYETISSIIESFKDINPTWLITGEGCMMKNEDESNSEEVVRLRERINFLEKQNELLTNILSEKVGMSKPSENVKGKSA